MLADLHFHDRELRNHAMEILISKHNSWSELPIWRGTTEDCPLRSFMVEWIFHHRSGFVQIDEFEFAEEFLAYPADFQQAFDALVAERGVLPDETLPDDEDDEAFEAEMRMQFLESECEDEEEERPEEEGVD